jgi:hypothetical protein
MLMTIHSLNLHLLLFLITIVPIVWFYFTILILFISRVLQPIINQQLEEDSKFIDYFDLYVISNAEMIPNFDVQYYYFHLLGQLVENILKDIISVIIMQLVKVNSLVNQLS